MTDKPLGRKAYGSIAHLPGSRLGPGDHHAHEGQARIATVRVRDRHDTVVVQEKLDGSCVAVAKVGGEIIALGRAGYPATSSPYEQHQLFAAWVRERRADFDGLLVEGERVVGEWLAMAHGTRYDLTERQPFVAFDIIGVGQDEKNVPRATHDVVATRTWMHDIASVPTLHAGSSLSIEDAMARNRGLYGNLDPVEGAVWRVERQGRVDFLVKWVRPDKVDGAYFADVTGGQDVWNWRPKKVAA